MADDDEVISSVSDQYGVVEAKDELEDCNRS
jgi:hypothetical protein